LKPVTDTFKSRLTNYVLYKAITKYISVHPNLFQNTALEAEYRTDWRSHNSLDFYPTGTWFVSLRAVLIDNFVFPESLQSKGAARIYDRIIFRIVFWDVLPCKIIVDRRFRGTCCLHHRSLKRRSTIILHGSTSQKTILNFILAAVRT